MIKYNLICFFLLFVLVFCNRKGWDLPTQNKIAILDQVQNKTLTASAVVSEGGAFSVKIKNQEQFDKINDYISDAIIKGHKNIIIEIDSGVYTFREFHINRDNEHLDNISIYIKGGGGVISSDDNYKEGKGIQDPWSETKMADSLIVIVDKEKKICFLPYKNTIKEEEKLLYSKIKITQWYQTQLYSITNVTNDGIYFEAPKLTVETGNLRTGYNVNYDYLYNGNTPRFRLFNKEFDSQSKASCFIRLENSSYKQIILEGLRFVGNKTGGQLIEMKNVGASRILFEDCTFNHIRGDLAFFEGTSNVCFEKNLVGDLGGNGLRFVKNSNNVCVTHNFFENCGESLGHTFCVSCWESTYYIADNIFCDFGYSAIGVGVWHGCEKKWPSRGIIEHNELYYTPHYIANKEKKTLMDSGAIYIWTQNDEVIIRYNNIHDYTGMGSNRGIFCDDGASNLMIYGNIISNIINSYTIDSRKIKDQKSTIHNNANNFMAHNIIDGNVRFVGYGDEERHCQKGANIVLGEQKSAKNKIAYLEKEEGDLYIMDGMIVKGKVFLTHNEKLTIKRLIKDRFICSFIEEKL